MRCQPLIVFSLLAAALPPSPTASDAAVASSIKSIGCYSLTNQGNKDIYDEMMFLYRGEMRTSNGTTPRDCGELCLLKGLQFAAIKQTECSCGASMDGMRRAENGSGTDMCSEACAGDSSQRCGGSDVISVYELTPEVLTPMPSRCEGGSWTVRLNRSAGPLLIPKSLSEFNLFKSVILSNTSDALINSPASLDSCMRRCEGVPTCWFVLVIIKPSVGIMCTLMDQSISKEIATTKLEASADSLLFSLVEWTCGEWSGAVGGCAASLTVMMAAAACRLSLTNLGP